MRSTGPFLYMPMEIASRELDSRLLIALFAVQAGLEVVLGQKWLLQKNARHMPKGFWIFKTLTPGDAKQMTEIKQLGHRISAIDEEMPGLGRGCGRLRWVDHISVETCEAIFCLGKEHIRCMAEKYPEHAAKLIETGNPRWDFLRPEIRSLYAHDAESIKAKYGRFILINTNIGLMNSAKSSPEKLISSLTRDGRVNLSIPEDRAFIDNIKTFESANFTAALSLVGRLGHEFPAHSIVLRPHPTEKLEPYERELAGKDRVFILREGSATAWLSACEVLVHTSCTTGVEAYALGKPSVCFQTIASPLHTYFLSSALSVIATHEDEVVNALKAILNTRREPTEDREKREIFHGFFAGQDGMFAAAQIANFVTESVAKASLSEKPKWRAGWLFRRKWFASKFQRKIFPDFSETEIAARLTQLAQVVGFDGIPHVTKCGDGQYHIYSHILEKAIPRKWGFGGITPAEKLKQQMQTHPAA